MRKPCLNKLSPLLQCKRVFTHYCKKEDNWIKWNSRLRNVTVMVQVSCSNVFGRCTGVSGQKSPAGHINLFIFKKRLVLSIFIYIVFPLTLTQLNEDRQNLRLVLTIKQKHQHEVKH